MAADFFKKNRGIEVVFVLLFFVLLAIFSYQLAKDIELAFRALAFEHIPFGELVREHKKFSRPSDPNYVGSWMTFRYVNVIFKLPENYLKDTLKISDSHYPNITVSRYAKENKLNEQALVARVRQAVRDYLALPH